MEVKKKWQSPELLRQRAEITKRNEVGTGRQETKKVHILLKAVVPPPICGE
jgi:hypothetical protein